MTAKNAVAKVWKNNAGTGPITPCYDGKRRSKYRDGELAPSFQTAPTLLSTDIRGITRSNNYNGNGSWFKVICYGAGTWTALGTSAGAKIMVRCPTGQGGDNTFHEVASYVHVGLHRTYPRTQLIEIQVQIGALGGTIAAGSVLDVRMDVNGTSSNILTARLIDQGARDFYFVDNLIGNDATGVKNDPLHPYRFVQNYSAGPHTYTGIWNLAGTHWVAGDTIVPRGTGTNWTDQTGVDGRWASFGRDPNDGNWTGADPTGAGGAAGKGFFTFYPYAGESVHGVFGGGGGGGGIDGADTDGALHGYSQFVQVAGFHIETLANSGRDAAPINTQYSQGPWIVNDNELGPYAVSGSEGNVNCGGWSGQMNGTTNVRGEVCWNYIHDIAGLSDLQNHGIYAGGGHGNTGYDNNTTNTDIIGNWVSNTPGGTNIQCFWVGSNSLTMTGMTVSGNFCEGSGKYAINIGESFLAGTVSNNIVVNPGWCAIRFASPSSNASTAIVAECNTFYGCNSANGGGTGTVCVLIESNVDQGFIKISHNIVCAVERGAISNLFYGFNSSTDANVQLVQNLWYDFAGTLTTVPGKDASGIYGDPHFTNRAASPPDLTRQSGGDMTTTDLLSLAADFYTMPRGLGAHKWNGACEGVGV